MPRYVDPVERRREITAAAVRILARSGPRSLTLRSLGEELGGSITLVTHFISNREHLFSAMLDDLLSSWDGELEELENGAGAEDRLRILLHWMLPMTERDREEEAAWIALLPHRSEHDTIAQSFEKMEIHVRAMLRKRLLDLADVDIDVEAATAFLRASAKGIALSAVEHPNLWPADVQRQTIELALQAVVQGIRVRDGARPSEHRAVDRT